jgi:hypothetical protein
MKGNKENRRYQFSPLPLYVIYPPQSIRKPSKSYSNDLL